MSTNSKKTLLRIVLLSSLAAALLTVTYATIFIASNSVNVGVEYRIELTHTVEDTLVTLDATVYNNGGTVGANYVVDFYYSVYGSDWTYFDTQITDDSGYVQSTYSITANGSYDFQAIATIP
ncbi:hypothetical protein [[Eubacterium] cellulosolvens]